MQLNALVFATLIDQTSDKAGHMSRLMNTREERQDLLRQLNTEFGSKLNQEHQNGVVGAASVLKAYLQKDYTPSDEA